MAGVLILCLTIVLHGMWARSDAIKVLTETRQRRQAVGTILDQGKLAKLFDFETTGPGMTTEESEITVPPVTTSEATFTPSTDSVPSVTTTPSTGSSSTCKDQCVPYYLCQNGHVITDGEGVIDIRFDAPNINSFLDNERTQFSVTDGTCPGFLQVCCKHVRRPVSPAYTPACGRHNKNGVISSVRNLDQSETQFGEFPWMVMIIKAAECEGDKDMYVCGGSLIEEDVVLTAAHCVKGRSAAKLKVRLGEWDTQVTNEVLPSQDIAVQRYIFHENFRPGNLWHDVALLFLQHPANLTHHVDTICLPEPGFNFTGSNCFTAGWGNYDIRLTDQDRVVLRKEILPVVQHSACEEFLRRTRLSRFFRLHKSFVCAGNSPESDTCLGDGGGPLVCADPISPDRNVQVGIVSWGIGCGLDGTPGVYTDVIQFSGWIQKHIKLFQEGETTLGSAKKRRSYSVRLFAGPMNVAPLGAQ